MSMIYSVLVVLEMRSVFKLEIDLSACKKESYLINLVDNLGLDSKTSDNLVKLLRRLVDHELFRRKIQMKNAILKGISSEKAILKSRDEIEPEFKESARTNTAPRLLVLVEKPKENEESVKLFTDTQKRIVKVLERLEKQKEMHILRGINPKLLTPTKCKRKPNKSNTIYEQSEKKKTKRRKTDNLTERDNLSRVSAVCSRSCLISNKHALNNSNIPPKRSENRKNTVFIEKMPSFSVNESNFDEVIEIVPKDSAIRATHSTRPSEEEKREDLDLLVKRHQRNSLRRKTEHALRFKKKDLTVSQSERSSLVQEDLDKYVRRYLRYK